MPGGNSQSSGYSSISGVDAPGPENRVLSDAVSKDGGNSAAANFGPGSSVAGSSNSSYLPSAVEEKRNKSFCFWKIKTSRRVKSGCVPAIHAQILRGSPPWKDLLLTLVLLDVRK